MSTHIGIMTGQNTGNLTPAIQLSATKFIAIETDFAREQNWALRFIRVARENGIEEIKRQPLKDTESADIAEMTELFTKYCKDEQQITFNITGGQKPPQLALWNVFNRRLDEGFTNDKAVYIGFRKGVGYLEYWWQKDGKLKHKEIPCSVPYRITDLLALSGIDVVDNNNKQVLYRRSKNGAQQAESRTIDVNDYLEDATFRSFMYQVGNEISINLMRQETTPDKLYAHWNQQRPLYTKAIHKKIENWTDPALEQIKNFSRDKDKVETLEATLNQLREKKSADKIFRLIEKKTRKFQQNELNRDDIDISDSALLQKVFTNNKSIQLNYKNFKKVTSYEKPATYFEAVLQKRFLEQLSSYDHYVSDVMANVSVKDSETHKTIAEHDILIATTFGTLISVDAKVFTITSKDLDARLYNLFQSGGAYAKFVLAFPFYTQDIEEGSLLAKPILNGLRRLVGNNRELYVCGNTTNSIKKTISLGNEPNTLPMTLKNFDFFLNDQKLIAQ